MYQFYSLSQQKIPQNIPLNPFAFLTKKEGNSRKEECKNCEKFYPVSDFFFLEYEKIIQEAENRINSQERDIDSIKYHQQKILFCPKVDFYQSFNRRI